MAVVVVLGHGVGLWVCGVVPSKWVWIWPYTFTCAFGLFGQEISNLNPRSISTPPKLGLKGVHVTEQVWFLQDQSAQVMLFLPPLVSLLFLRLLVFLLLLLLLTPPLILASNFPEGFPNCTTRSLKAPFTEKLPDGINRKSLISLPPNSFAKHRGVLPGRKNRMAFSYPCIQQHDLVGFFPMPTVQQGQQVSTRVEQSWWTNAVAFPQTCQGHAAHSPAVGECGQFCIPSTLWTHDQNGSKCKSSLRAHLNLFSSHKPFGMYVSGLVQSQKSWRLWQRKVGFFQSTDATCSSWVHSIWPSSVSKAAPRTGSRPFKKDMTEEIFGTDQPQCRNFSGMLSKCGRRMS